MIGQQQGNSNKAVADKVTFYRIDYNDPDSVRAFVTSTYKNKDGWRYPYEKQWFTNIAYLSG